MRLERWKEAGGLERSGTNQTNQRENENEEGERARAIKQDGVDFSFAVRFFVEITSLFYSCFKRFFLVLLFAELAVVTNFCNF